MNEYRYMVRKEYFGAYVYDGKEKMYLLFDKESYELFLALACDFRAFDDLDEDVQELMAEEEFVCDGHCNFFLIDNGDYGNVLSTPMRMHLLYTEECNLNCIHCFSRESKNSASMEMSFQDKVSILDEMRKIGICEILIGGGEPFIREDLFDFIEECNRRSITAKIFTNGLLIGDHNIARIAKMKVAYLSFSVDGTTEDNYRITRGINGLQTVVDNIKRLKELGCTYPLLISTTINHYNCQNPELFLELVYETSADRLKIRATKPNGNILQNQDVMVSPHEYRDFLLHMQKAYNQKYKDMFKLDLTWGDYRLVYDEDANALVIENTDLPYGEYGCVAGKTTMCINSCGTATPCGFLPDALQPTESENVITRSILDVWHHGESFCRLRNIPQNAVCSQCEQYEVCRGGCIARIMFDKQPINGIDPWCIKEFFPIGL